MYKSRFFQVVLRAIDWMNERRQEIYFILMAIILLSAISFGVYMYIYYMKNPMFKNPSTITEHFAEPVFIGMLSTTIILVFGMFLAHSITMIPFKRIKLFKMEMEFDSYTNREKEIANQFLYSSTMLHNHTENVRYLLDNDFSELKQVLQFLTDSYKENALQYHNELTLTIDVMDPSDINGREEKKLYISINQQQVPNSNTAYTNRLLSGENLLVGSISVGDTEEAVMIVKRGYNEPFDIYDQETFESILGYAIILFDTIIMFNILQDNNILDISNDAHSDV
jgi:hypothetical protein